MYLLNRDMGDTTYTDAVIASMPSQSVTTMNNLYYSVPTAAGVRKMQQVYLKIGGLRSDSDPTLQVGRVNHMKAILRNYIQRFKDRYSGKPAITPTTYPAVSTTVLDTSPMTLLSDAQIDAITKPAEPFTTALPVTTETTTTTTPFVDTIPPGNGVTPGTTVTTPATNNGYVYEPTTQAAGLIMTMLQQKAAITAANNALAASEKAVADAAAARAATETVPGATNVVKNPDIMPASPEVQASFFNWKKYLPLALGLGAAAFVFAGDSK
jgi:hypothetical protein